MHGNMATVPSDKSDKRQPQKCSNAGHRGRIVCALLLPCDGTMTQPMYIGADAGPSMGCYGQMATLGCHKNPESPATNSS